MNKLQDLELQLILDLENKLSVLSDKSPNNIERCMRGFLFKNMEELLKGESIRIISFIEHVVEPHFEKGHHTFDSLIAIYINYLLENKFIKEALLLFKKYRNAEKALSRGFALLSDYLGEMTRNYTTTYTAEQIILFLTVVRDNFRDTPYYRQCVSKVEKSIEIEIEKMENPGKPLSKKLLTLIGYITPT